MSRAKKFIHNGEEIWFDYKNPAPTVPQLEALSDWSGISLDDLLDEGLTQKKAAQWLFDLQDPDCVPPEVRERRRLREEEQANAPACRWCGHEHLECEGGITRHHFIPRWLMLMLDNYEAYAARSMCTIPICLGRHRDLHSRTGNPKSIAHLLSEREKMFAQKLLDELQEQHPATFDLISYGDEHSYEAQLVQDYLLGRFFPSETIPVIDSDVVRVESAS